MQFLSAAAFVASVLALASRPGEVSAQASSINGQRPPCVTVTQGSVFNGTGYNHLVTIASACERPVNCTVTTNANPQPNAVTVAPRQSQTVNTFLGSPAAVFTPTVACAMP